jgi:CubicO group peptidase (beta-lactamase class C family)
MICNGIFVSQRTLDQIYEQELRLNELKLQPPSMVTIDRALKAVAVKDEDGATMRAAYREGLGGIVLAPHQTFADIEALPELTTPAPAGNPAEIAWPDGDLLPKQASLDGIHREALAAAAEFTFNRATYGHPSQVTISLLVVHRGQIVYEKYAPGFNVTTRTRTWSAAKSIAVTLIGIAAEQGRLKLDEPLPVVWGPAGLPAAEQDPRRGITLRHVLNMSSGLDPVDNHRPYTMGSSWTYFGGGSYARAATHRGLVRQPGSHWDYENFDTLLAVAALKRSLGDKQTYLEFPHRELFDRIGMRNTIASTDRFGDYVLSSQVYTNARDLARLGLLYLNNGMWGATRILPESWVQFVRTPAPSTVSRGGHYGAQFWLVPDNRTDVPKDGFAMVGSRGQVVIVIPSSELVIVRRGLDQLPDRHAFPTFDLAARVAKAFLDSSGK